MEKERESERETEEWSLRRADADWLTDGPGRLVIHQYSW